VIGMRQQIGWSPTERLTWRHGLVLGIPTIILTALALTVGPCREEPREGAHQAAPQLSTTYPPNAPSPLPAQQSAAQVDAASRPQLQTSGVTVYVTDEGERYHAAGCAYLRKSSRPMDLAAAQRAGYTPCSKCCY